jgi:hypothetical protein
MNGDDVRLKQIGSRLTYANVMATGAMFVALGGGAYALSGVPDRSGVFHGCVATSGALRVVAKASSCRKAKTVTRGKHRVRIPGESAIAWNQQGRPGVNGVNGATGLNGANGASGATNLVVRSEAHSGFSGEFVPQCNPGERAVGGGVSRADGSTTGGDVVTQSAPAIRGASPRIAQPGETPTAWADGVDATSTGNFVFYVVCASP